MPAKKDEGVIVQPADHVELVPLENEVGAPENAALPRFHKHDRPLVEVLV